MSSNRAYFGGSYDAPVGLIGVKRYPTPPIELICCDWNDQDIVKVTAENRLRSAAKIMCAEQRRSDIYHHNRRNA
jgi:hypothetical protein